MLFRRNTECSSTDARFWNYRRPDNARTGDDLESFVALAEVIEGLRMNTSLVIAQIAAGRGPNPDVRIRGKCFFRGDGFAPYLVTSNHLQGFSSLRSFGSVP
jgi:hypothetical protein